MPWSTQFAISLETTKLMRFLPPTVEKVFELAKALQCSGSDLVAEEDIVELFGRMRIDSNLSTSFRAAVTPSNQTPICTEIVLESGPGPTIQRALLAGQTSYLAMVVQCSLLATALDPGALATDIRSLLDRSLSAKSDDSDGATRVVASEELIDKFLRTCQEQASAYPWNNLIQAVGLQLGIGNESIQGSLPHSIFTGLVSSLPIVQQLPHNRFIYIEIGAAHGIAPLVVWVHHVLGLSVQVNQYYDGQRITTSFGNGDVQIVIDAQLFSSEPNYTVKLPCLTLFEADDEGKRAELFRIVEEPDDTPISCVRRLRAADLTTILLAKTQELLIGVGGMTQQAMNSIVAEMQQLITAYAIEFAKGAVMNHGRDLNIALAPHDSDEESDVDFQDEDEEALSRGRGERDMGNNENIEPTPDPATRMPYKIQDWRVLKAARFLFGQKEVNANDVAGYVNIFSKNEFTYDYIPGNVSAILTKFPLAGMLNVTDLSNDASWRSIVDTAKLLAMIILAFAHVENLEDCAELPLLENIKLIQAVPIARAVRTAGLAAAGSVLPTSWFDVVSSLLIEDYEAARRKYPSASLVSERGWSIYLSTFMQSEDGNLPKSQDPSAIPPGRFRISKGVPCRNNVRKHFIVDGPYKGRLSAFDWQVEHEAGSNIRIRCASSVRVARPLYGERQDSFMISLRFIHVDHQEQHTRRTGYFEMFNSLALVRSTDGCQHSLNPDMEYTLDPGFVTVSGFGDEQRDTPGNLARVAVCLTADSTPARWRTLISIFNSTAKWRLDRYQRPILIKTDDCCFLCAIGQIAHLRTRWFVIL